MPNLKSLFIDTATELGSIALYNNDTLLFSKQFSSQLKHLQAIHPSINEMLTETKTELEDIDVIGVDIGPGSFTGIRIGVTTARTLAQISNNYIFGITSLDIIAKSIPYYDNLLCVTIDGKKKRFFTAFYKFKNNRVERISNYMDIGIDELFEKVNKYNKEYKEIKFLGTGQSIYHDRLCEADINTAFTMDSAECCNPEAKNIYFFMDEDKLTREYEKVIPFYLRKSDAEENYIPKL